MEKPLIYIVEDDEGICEVYEGAFEVDYNARFFENGTTFLSELSRVRPNLVILDIMLPDMDGYTILSKIRDHDPLLPVIIVSAKSDEISFVKGLNKGADDYMAKPFSIMELLARVKTNLRRASHFEIKKDGLYVDTNLYKAFYNNLDLGLTLKEFMLLKLLVNRAGVTIERETLFKEVWGESFIGETRTIDMHIASLREKISKSGAEANIVTVRGVGYRYESK